MRAIQALGISLVAALCLGGVREAARPAAAAVRRVVVVVLPFALGSRVSTDSQASWQAAEMLGNAITTSRGKVTNLQVVEDGRLRDILKRFRTEASGLYSQSDQEQILQLARADYLLLGTITRIQIVQDSRQQSGGILDGIGGLRRKGPFHTTFGMEVRLVDPQGRVVDNCAWNTEGTADGTTPSIPGAAREAANEIVAAMAKTPAVKGLRPGTPAAPGVLSGRLLRDLDGTRMVIETSGLEKGKRYRLSRLENVRNRDGQVVFPVKHPFAEVEVEDTTTLGAQVRVILRLDPDTVLAEGQDVTFEAIGAAGGK